MNVMLFTRRHKDTEVTPPCFRTLCALSASVWEIIQATFILQSQIRSVLSSLSLRLCATLMFAKITSVSGIFLRLCLLPDLRIALQTFRKSSPSSSSIPSASRCCAFCQKVFVPGQNPPCRENNCRREHAPCRVGPTDATATRDRS